MSATISDVKRKIKELKTELKDQRSKLKEMESARRLSLPPEKQNVPTKEQVRDKLNERYSHLGNMKRLYDYADRVMNKPEFRANPRAYIQNAIQKRGSTEELRIPQDPVRNVLAQFLGFRHG